MFEIVDIQSKTVISTHKTRQFARRKADRLDLKYGAIRYVVREKKEPEPTIEPQNISHLQTSLLNLICDCNELTDEQFHHLFHAAIAFSCCFPDREIDIDFYCNRGKK